MKIKTDYCLNCECSKDAHPIAWCKKFIDNTYELKMIASYKALKSLRSTPL